MIKPKSMQCQHLYRLNFRYESIIIMNNDLVARQIFCWHRQRESDRDLALVLFFFSQSISPSSHFKWLNGVNRTKRDKLLCPFAILSPTKKISLASRIFFYRIFIMLSVSLCVLHKLCVQNQITFPLSLCVYESESKARNPKCTKSDEYDKSKKKKK